MRTKHKIIVLAAIAIAAVELTVVSAVHSERAAEKRALTSTALPHSPAQSREPKLMAEASRLIVAAARGEKIDDSAQVLGETTTSSELTTEQISDISNPSVVRIFNYITGTITIPDFRINLTNFDLLPQIQLYTENVDVGTTGTGFFVAPDGYILTNAHVIDTDMALESFIQKAANYYSQDIKTALLQMDEAEITALDKTLSEKYGSNPEDAAVFLQEDLSAKLRHYVETNSETKLDQKITVLSPSSRGAKIKTRSDLVNLVKSSIPARIIEYNKDFFTSHKDAGLIKIEEQYTPTLSLNVESKINTGQKIYTIGYPDNASVDASDYFNSTLSEGTVGSVKKFGNVEVYQTDAKISQGSSGGPVMDRNGKVIGMMTYVNEGDSQGDSFAYALPIQHGADLLATNNIALGTSYADNYMAGLTLAAQNFCRQANEKFMAAKGAYGQFSDHESLQKYIDRCNQMIAEGGSLDSAWDKTMHSIGQVPIYAWVGLLVIIGIVTGVGIYIKKSHQGPMLIQPPRPQIPTSPLMR